MKKKNHKNLLWLAVYCCLLHIPSCRKARDLWLYTVLAYGQKHENMSVLSVSTLEKSKY